MTTNVEDFKKIIRDSLASRGVLQDLQSNLRSEIFKSLHEPSQNDQQKVCQENLVINELIREYLEYNKYTNALSVFSLESRTSRTGSLSRDVVKTQLNIEESPSSQRLPLIYGIVSMLENARGSEALAPNLQYTRRPNADSRESSRKADEYEIDDNGSLEEVGFVESLPVSVDEANSPRNEAPSADEYRSASMGMYSANDFEYSSADDEPGDGSRMYGGLAGDTQPAEVELEPYQDPNDYSDSVNVMAIEDLI